MMITNGSNGQSTRRRMLCDDLKVSLEPRDTTAVARRIEIAEKTTPVLLQGLIALT